MKTSVLCLSAIFLAGIAVADPYVIAKSQAKREAGKSNAQQGVAPAPPNPPVARLAPPPTDPALAATLQNITSLGADLTAINHFTGAKPDAELKIALMNDLLAAAKGAKPASASVQKLAGHLVAAVAGKKTAPAEQNQLARNLHALFNSSHLAAAQQQAMLDDTRKILEGSGAGVDEVAGVLADLKQIATETK